MSQAWMHKQTHALKSACLVIVGVRACLKNHFLGLHAPLRGLRRSKFPVTAFHIRNTIPPVNSPTLMLACSRLSVRTPSRKKPSITISSTL